MRPQRATYNLVKIGALTEYPPTGVFRSGKLDM
jgi:hypothetical protein